VGLPRTPEPFPRVYSAPEPPSSPRRSLFLRILTALVAFAVAGGAVYYFGTRGSGERRAQPSVSAPSPTTAAPSPTTASSAPATSASPTVRSSSPVPAGLWATGPQACRTPDRATYTRLVPSPQVRPGGDPLATLCTITSAKQADTSLRVEARLFPSGGTADPVKAATDFFAADLAEAKNPGPLSTTIGLARPRGLGDEAFTWSREDKGLPTIVAEVEARTRNGVIRVTYSHDPGPQETSDAASRRFLASAIEAARQVLAAYA
jgi:hypothetical protein